MNEDQIKHMVSRFLGWKLPKAFAPDNHISFQPAEYQKTGPNAQAHWPSGTNLFNAIEAEAMVRHMLEGLLEVPDVDALRRIGQECISISISAQRSDLVSRGRYQAANKILEKVKSEISAALGEKE